MSKFRTTVAIDLGTRLSGVCLQVADKQFRFKTAYGNNADAMAKHLINAITNFLNSPSDLKKILIEVPVIDSPDTEEFSCIKTVNERLRSVFLMASIETLHAPDWRRILRFDREIEKYKTKEDYDKYTLKLIAKRLAVNEYYKDFPDASKQHGVTDDEAEAYCMLKAYRMNGDTFKKSNKGKYTKINHKYQEDCNEDYTYRIAGL